MRTLAITSPEELRQADHKAVIAWERYMRETERAASSTRHCQLNELSPPSSSLSPDFRAAQQARLAFSDPDPRATDSRSVPRRLVLAGRAGVRGSYRPDKLMMGGADPRRSSTHRSTDGEGR